VRTDRLTEAAAAYDAALTAYRAIDARLGEANTRQALGDLYVRTARLTEAETAYEAALTAYRAIDDRLGEANTRQALGDLYVRTARLTEAEAAYEAALTAYRAIDDQLGEANTRSALGVVALTRGHALDAFEAFRQARVALLRLEERLGAAGQLGYMARAAAALGDHDRALVLGGMAWSELHALADRYGEMLVATDLVGPALASGDEALVVLAVVIAFHHAREIDPPLAAQLEPLAADDPRPGEGGRRAVPAGARGTPGGVCRVPRSGEAATHRPWGGPDVRSTPRSAQPSPRGSVTTIAVLSDLHIAPPGPLASFHAGAELAGLLGRLRAKHDVDTLLLAGDIVDLLALPDSTATLDPATIPARLTDLFHEIGATPWGAQVLGALGDLATAGVRVVVLPGNHDPELAHPEAMSILRKACGLGADDRRIAPILDPARGEATAGPSRWWSATAIAAIRGTTSTLRRSCIARRPIHPS
jgi:tetratricopeptide (TPR) repeat protein